MAPCIVEIDTCAMKAQHAITRRRHLSIKRTEFERTRKGKKSDAVVAVGEWCAEALGRSPAGVNTQDMRRSSSMSKAHRGSRAALRSRLAQGIVHTSADMPRIISTGCQRSGVHKKLSVARLVCREKAANTDPGLSMWQLPTKLHAHVYSDAETTDAGSRSRTTSASTVHESSEDAEDIGEEVKSPVLEAFIKLCQKMHAVHQEDRELEVASKVPSQETLTESAQKAQEVEQDTCKDRSERVASNAVACFKKIGMQQEKRLAAEMRKRRHQEARALRERESRERCSTSAATKAVEVQEIATLRHMTITEGEDIVARRQASISDNGSEGDEIVAKARVEAACDVNDAQSGPRRDLMEGQAEEPKERDQREDALGQPCTEVLAASSSAAAGSFEDSAWEWLPDVATNGDFPDSPNAAHGDSDIEEEEGWSVLA